MTLDYKKYEENCMVITKDFITYLLSQSETSVRKCNFDEVDLQAIKPVDRQKSEYFYTITSPVTKYTYTTIMLFCDSIYIKNAHDSHLVPCALWNEIHTILQDHIDSDNLSKYMKTLEAAMIVAGFDRIRKVNNLLM